MKTPYKYNIHSKLEELSVKRNRIAKDVLPLALKITKRTFENYCYIKIGDRDNISPDKLQILANYFECSIEELINEPMPIIDYEALEKKINKNN